MIQLLNEDLAGEYQAIIAYTVYSQILKGVQAGIVFIFFGAGLLRLHAWNIGDEGPLVFGTLALALGLGFGVAAAVSYFLSRSFGLLSR